MPPASLPAPSRPPPSVLRGSPRVAPAPLRSVEGFIDGGMELAQGERLGEADFLALAQEPLDTLADDVTGDKDHAFGEGGIAGAHALVDLLAIKAGHFPIAQRQVVASLVDAPQGGFAVGSDIDLVTLGLERG